MQYICHRRYNKIGADCQKHLIKRKTVLEPIGQYIADGKRAVCKITSDDFCRYFARNDDGNGLERGKLTFEIAYSKRKPNKDNGFRFTENEISLLREKYSKFLIDDDVTLNFNQEFFNANIEELRNVYADLGWG